ncbi:MAG: hypothetical protein ACYCQI_12355 [Gammaproteobacteria bacterium]
MQSARAGSKTASILKLLGSEAIAPGEKHIIIETPDQKKLDLEIRESEKKADAFYKRVIKEILINSDEYKKNHYEKKIVEIRKNILKILPKHYRFSHGIENFISDQGTGENSKDKIHYDNKYEESMLFQAAFHDFPQLKTLLQTIRNLFNEHNQYVDLLAKIMSQLNKDPTSTSIIPTYAKHVSKSTEESCSTHKESEVDYLFNHSVAVCLRRQNIF